MTVTRKWDFFIAHSSADVGHAEDLYEWLAAKSKVFLDSKSIKLGDSWDVALLDAQRNSLVVVVIVSRNSDKSYYLRDEIATAISLSRSDSATVRVVPIYVDGYPAGADDLMPYGLRIKHGVALSDSITMRDAAEQLLSLLAELREEERPGGMPAGAVGARVAEGYQLDICMCLDTGGSIIGGPEEGRVLRELQTFPALLSAHMAVKNKRLDAIRVRTISFGASLPLQHVGVNKETDFSESLTGSGQWLELLAEVRARVSQPNLESAAVQAIRKAIESDWEFLPSGRSRQIIAIWSDTLPLQDKKGIDSLYRKWSHLARTKRLLIYAPDCQFWETIADDFENTLWFPSVAGKGLEDYELEEILTVIVSTV